MRGSQLMSVTEALRCITLGLRGKCIQWTAQLSVLALFILMSEAALAADFIGRITEVHLNSEIAGRGVCIRTNPRLPGTGWLCLWQDNPLYTELQDVLSTAFSTRSICTFVADQQDPQGNLLLEGLDCSPSSAAAGTITRLHLNSEIADRGVCIRTTPEQPGTGWLCLWQDNPLYTELQNALSTAFSTRSICTFVVNQSDPRGDLLLEGLDCLPRSAATGNIARLHLNSEIAGRGVCVRTTPEQPGTGWLCLWQDNPLYAELHDVLRSSTFANFGGRATCTFVVNQQDPRGDLLLEGLDCLPRSAATGTITQLHLNNDIAGRGVCVRTTPEQPGTGWLCLWQDNPLYAELDSLLHTAFYRQHTCIFLVNQPDPRGDLLLEVASCRR